MYFNSFSDFLAMGGTGHAPYVWGAFGITFLALFILLFLSLKQSRQQLKDIKVKIDRQTRIRAAKDMENTL